MRDVTSTMAIVVFALWSVLALFPGLPRRLVGGLGVVLSLLMLGLLSFWKIELPISRTLDSALGYGAALVLMVTGLVLVRQSLRAGGGHSR